MLDFKAICKHATLDTLKELGLKEEHVVHSAGWKRLKEKFSYIGELQTYKENLESAKKWNKEVRAFLVKHKHDLKRNNSI